jgi:hypothetical protein
VQNSNTKKKNKKKEVRLRCEWLPPKLGTAEVEVLVVGAPKVKVDVGAVLAAGAPNVDPPKAGVVDAPKREPAK